MMEARLTPETLAANEASLRTLERSLLLAQGQFSLILVRCNYERLRNGLLEHLRQQSTLGFQTLTLPETGASLYATIKEHLPEAPPTALMIVGLESVLHPEALFGGANLMRDEFRNSFSFPLVLWLNDRTFQFLSEFGSDFKSWSTTSIPFRFPIPELVRSLHRHAEQMFDKILQAGGDRFLPDVVLELEPGSQLRTELEFALRDIAVNGHPLDAALQASLDFLQGRDAHIRLELDEARESYERSLNFWQSAVLSASESTPESISESTVESAATNSEILLPMPCYRYRQGVLLFYLGLWWRSYAVLQRTTYRVSCEQAQSYFEQCLRLFGAEGRQDLVGRFIPALQEVLQKLGDWDHLAEVTQGAIALHSDTDPVRLARDYGFLAEVALTQDDPIEAQYFAEKALQKLAMATPASAGEDVLAELSLVERYYRGWFLFLLGRSQTEQGDREGAIAQMEAARQAVNPQEDAILYIQILRQLRSLYFRRGYFREAFQVRQLRRQIEQQYGFRAFAGAAQLEHQQLATFPELAPASPEAIVAQEIAASGRQDDVRKLIERIALPKDRLTVIHGPSGVGKSSTLSAGLVPALRDRTIEARRILPVMVSVYTDWITALDKGLEHALQGVGWAIAPTPLANLPPPTVQTLINQLQQNQHRYLYTVLIFDQFEEFFSVCSDLSQRRPFYHFLKTCLNIPYIKVVLSLREDYLYYLLEIDRLVNLEDIISDGILSKSVRYPLWDFSPSEATSVIQTLTARSQFYLEERLITALVQDLTGEFGGVRPIELQIVGAQLQQDKITTLAAYRELGDHPKQTLVQRFLQEVVQDCGPPNEAIAQLVLFLLTNEDSTRPLKTRLELAEELFITGLAFTEDQLDLVLEILVGSRLVLKLPETPHDLYQLVHDYLVSYVRQKQAPEVVQALQDARKHHRTEEKQKYHEAQLTALSLQRELSSANRTIAHLRRIIVALGAIALILLLVLLFTAFFKII